LAVAVVQDRVSRPAARYANAVGAFAGALTWAWYFSGSTRAFGYDSSITVGFFVTRGNALDAFRSQYAYNNHPLISFVEHLVVDVSGSRSEQMLRLLPITCAAATVALVCAWTARRYGTFIGALAGLVVAFNPSFVEHGTEIRGYSLMVLAAVASTMALVHILERDASPGLPAGYIVLVAIGVAAHLAMLVVVAGQFCLVLQSRHVRSRRRELAVAAVTGVATGLLAYVVLVSTMVSGTGSRHFQLSFPGHLWIDMLGGSLLTALLLTPSILIAVTRNPEHSRLVAPASIVVCAIAVGWVVAPPDFYTRFFLWLVPLAAIAVAAGVARVPALACAVLLAFVPQIATDTRFLGADANANRSGGAVLRAADRDRRTVCSAGTDSDALVAYIGTIAKPRFPHTPRDVAGCDALLVLRPARQGRIVSLASKTFARCAVLPARVDAHFYWTRPFPGMPEHGDACARNPGVG
jgi:Dolichyl-phosphate-mannose-protein mannosyltransferase